MVPVRKRPKICKDVQAMLDLTREQRGDQEANGNRLKEAFGLRGDNLTLKDLDDWQLLQALFIEANWALGQQAQEVMALKSFAGLNRQTRRRAVRQRGG
jgi:hypothetical protein